MQTNYKGKLLVATPVLNGNVVFAQSVVYIYDDKRNGKNPRQISGVILNKPSQFKISSLGSLKDIPFDPSLEMKFVYKGGPVSDTSVVLLHTNEWVSTNTLKADHNLSITSDLLMIEKLATGNEPKGWRMFAGMSVWTPEQLDTEINEQHAWLTCDPANHCVFDYDQEEQWLKALELCSSQILSNYI
jgi:putative transcriptional regulator